MFFHVSLGHFVLLAFVVLGLVSSVLSQEKDVSKITNYFVSSGTKNFNSVNNNKCTNVPSANLISFHCIEIVGALYIS